MVSKKRLRLNYTQFILLKQSEASGGVAAGGE